jgi:hypothetical protein
MNRDPDLGGVQDGVWPRSVHLYPVAQRTTRQEPCGLPAKWAQTVGLGGHFVRIWQVGGGSSLNLIRNVPPQKHLPPISQGSMSGCRHFWRFQLAALWLERRLAIRSSIDFSRVSNEVSY